MIIGCIMALNSEMFVENALKSLSAVADRIIVVDGGSIDSTVDISRRYTDEVIVNKWTGNHSDQRNVYLKYIKKNYPKSWCFSLDSDETIDQDKSAVIPELCNTEKMKFYWFRRKWLVGLDPPTYISSPPHFPDWQARLFKVEEKTEFSGHIHEVLTGKSLISKVRGIPYVRLFSRRVTNFDIFHLDLVLNSKAKRREKVEKYESIEQGSGGKDYYLPEDKSHNILVTPVKTRLILTDETIKNTKANEQYWKDFLKSETSDP